MGLRRFLRTALCLDYFLTSAGGDRLGGGIRVIGYIIKLLGYIGLGLAALFSVIFIIYVIAIVYLKVLVSVFFVFFKKLLLPLLWFLISYAMAIYIVILDLLPVLNFVSLILGFRRLANALPALINWSETPEGVPECVSDYFRGDAAEVLSRVYKYLLLILYFRLFIIFFISLILFAEFILVTHSAVLPQSLLLEVFKKAVMEVAVRVALGVLGVVITIAFSVGSLFIRGRAEPGGVTVVGKQWPKAPSSFIDNVRFFMFEQFVFAIFIIILSMAAPTAIAVLFFVPLILAVTIDLVTYIMLAITVIEHM
jgi:hypothetical protein